MTIVGFTEGSGHVCWRVVATHVMWWFMGFFVLLLATYALVAQGLARTLAHYLHAIYVACLLTQASLLRSPLPLPLPPYGPFRSSGCMACFILCCLCNVSTQHNQASVIQCFPNQAYSLTNMALPFIKVLSLLCHWLDPLWKLAYHADTAKHLVLYNCLSVEYRVDAMSQC